MGEMIQTEERRGSVLLEAEQTVNGTRQDCYGSPEDSFAAIADLWSFWLRTALRRRLTAHDVAMMMSLFKHARLMHRPDRDGYRDACGYLALACDIAGADEDVEKEAGR